MDSGVGARAKPEVRKSSAVMESPKPWRARRARGFSVATGCASNRRAGEAMAAADSGARGSRLCHHNLAGSVALVHAFVFPQSDGFVVVPGYAFGDSLGQGAHLARRGVVDDDRVGAGAGDVKFRRLGARVIDAHYAVDGFFRVL